MALHKRGTYSSRPTMANRRVHAMGERQFRTYDTTFIQPRRSKGPTVFAIVLCAIVIIALLFFFVSCSGGCSSDSSKLAANGTQVSVTVNNGDSVSTIATTLQNAGLLSKTKDFTDRVKSLGMESALMPGAYTIVAGTSVDDIIKALAAGPPEETFTVPEGSTIAKTADIVEEAYGGSITADQFKAAAQNASAYTADYPFVADAYNNSLEGFLFPKTYKIEDGDTADSVVRKMLTQYQTETASLNYTYSTSRNLTSYDVLIIASMVEREAAADNRATVASVFYNRLSAGMQLQSDATVAYVVNGDPTPADLKVDSPYNTYLNYGLPAGPICSPGLDSLQAACAPEKTNYLYFYFAEGSDGNMVYSFSENYEEHQDAIGGTLGSE